MIEWTKDVWSRWTGGSGAPAWTLEAAGFDLTTIEAAGAALTHQHYGDPLPKMIWGTNNWRIATATMFSLFFAGNDYAPRTKVGGVPIQDYLQDHFIAMASKVAETLKDERNVVGFDTLNEPNVRTNERTNERTNARRCCCCCCCCWRWRLLFAFLLLCPSNI